MKKGILILGLLMVAISSKANIPETGIFEFNCTEKLLSSFSGEIELFKLWGSTSYISDYDYTTWTVEDLCEDDKSDRCAHRIHFTIYKEDHSGLAIKYIPAHKVKMYSYKHQVWASIDGRQAVQCSYNAKI